MGADKLGVGEIVGRPALTAGQSRRLDVATVDSRGLPISGVAFRVECLLADGAPWRDSGQSGLAGVASVDLPSGVRWIRVSVVDVKWAGKPVKIMGYPQRQVALALLGRAVVVSGYIRDALGTPVGEASILVLPFDIETTSASDGSFSVFLPANYAECELLATGPREGFAAYSFATGDGGAVHGLNVALSEGVTVWGTVVDQEGKPVAGCGVYDAQLVAVTNARGEFVARNVRATGSLSRFGSLRFDHPEYVVLDVPFQAAPNSLRIWIPIVLEAGCLVHGVVVDEGGEPVPSGDVRIEGMAEGKRIWEIVAPIGDQGKFAAHVALGAQTLLLVLADGFECKYVVATGSQRVENLGRIPLARAISTELEVLGPDGRRIPEASVVRRRGEEVLPVRVLGPGRFELFSCGSSVVQVRAPGYRAREERAQDPVQPIWSVSLERDQEMRGRVFIGGPGGRPLPSGFSIIVYYLPAERRDASLEQALRVSFGFASTSGHWSLPMWKVREALGVKDAGIDDLILVATCDGLRVNLGRPVDTSPEVLQFRDTHLADAPLREARILLSSSGEPLAGARVFIPMEEIPSRWKPIDVTDGTGRFQVALLPNENSEVLVVHEDVGWAKGALAGAAAESPPLMVSPGVSFEIQGAGPEWSDGFIVGLESGRPLLPTRTSLNPGERRSMKGPLGEEFRVELHWTTRRYWCEVAVQSRSEPVIVGLSGTSTAIVRLSEVSTAAVLILTRAPSDDTVVAEAMEVAGFTGEARISGLSSGQWSARAFSLKKGRRDRQIGSAEFSAQGGELEVILRP